MKSVDFAIHKEGETKYKIVFSDYSEALIKSIVHSKQIDDIGVYKDYRTIGFTATSVQTYTEFRDGAPFERNRMSYDAALRMVSALATQLKYLIEVQSSCFCMFNLDNLVVIDGNKFVYMSNEHLCNLIPPCNLIPVDMLVIQPFSRKNNFVSPELLRVLCIPAKVDYRSAYYSLGALVMHCVSGNDCVSGNLGNFDNELKGTKLHAMLRRCLAEDPRERSILFV